MFDSGGGVTCVYWIRQPHHADIFTQGYVGITENMDYRMWRHSRCKTNAHLTNAIKKYRWDVLVKDVVLVSNTEYCLEIEKKLRPSKNVGWNIAIGGGKPTGWEVGSKLPKWVKEKISKGKTGKFFSQSHKENLSKAKVGKVGELANNYKSAIKATNLKTNEVLILRGKVAMEQIGLHDSAVYRCLKGKQASHKGYVFERVCS
jgi:hypothetical protein